MNERGVLEFAKAAGEVNIIPGYKLYTREYFIKIMIESVDVFSIPFIFVSSGKAADIPEITGCENEQNAMEAIKFLLALEE